MFLATQDKPFFSTDFNEKFQQIKELGFDAFEIDGAVLRENWKALEKASSQNQLPIKMVCGGYNGWIGDFSPERREQGLKDIAEILKISGEMGIKGIVVPAAWGMFSLRLPPMVPPRSAEEDKKVLLDSLAQLNKVAENTQTEIFLEPLNRYENHMLIQVEDAVSLIQEGQFSKVKVTADYFHMNIEEARIEGSLEKYFSYIGHIHLASSQRLEPGAGHLDYVPGMKVLHDKGYQGGYTIECRVLAEDPMKAYKDSVIFLRASLAKAGY